MGTIGNIEIKITGSKGNIELKPEVHDIKENKYDANYIKLLRDKASSWIKNISPDDWLNEIRGYNIK